MGERAVLIALFRPLGLQVALDGRKEEGMPQ